MATTHTFSSKSNPNVKYTLTVADDATMSCTCPGWCKRVAPDGTRDCTHTKQMRASGVPAPTLVETRDLPASPEAVGYVQPMLANALDGRRIEDFHPAEWWMERKEDGHRCVAAIRGGVVRAWSRPGAGADGRGLPRTLPAPIEAIMRVLPDLTLDGELVVPGGRCSDVTDAAKRTRLTFVVFDLLYYDGQDLTGQTNEQRRRLLNEVDRVWKQADVVACLVSPVFRPSREVVEAIWADGGEGVVLKRKAGRYLPGHRSDDWVKVKRLIPAVLTVVGYEAGKLGPHSTVVLRGDDGSEATVKTLNNEWRRRFGADPTAYLGRRLRIEHQGQRGTKYFHAMWDRFEEGD